MDFAETSSSLNDNNGEASSLPRSIEELKKPGRKKYFPTNSRFTEPSSSSAYFEGNKIYSVDVEDATHILRKMEFAAFQAVATAFRTQGPLTPYKELMLEHLRFALFIREHDFIQIIQEIADDTFLQKTCKTLNKSSSCSAQWRALSFPAHTPTNAYIRKPKQDIKARINLLTTIGCHNVSVKELDVATAKLSTLKKEQFIPQQLRRVLADSELSAGRVDIEPFDITEEELQRDFDDYEKEKERIANEVEEEERSRNGRSRRGKKRKVIIPRFQNQTLRAQARVAAKEVENSNEKKKKTDDDVPDEDEQCQAEAEMMKMIEDQAKGLLAAPPPPIVAVKVETKKTTASVATVAVASPQKVVQKAKAKRKSKDANKFYSSKETPKQPATLSLSQRHPQITPFTIVPEHLPPPKPLIITAKPPPSSSSNDYFYHPLPKSTNNRSEEQRAMDEDLVLVKTAQAMIEDLENTLDSENGLTSSGKRRKQKHDGTPKRRGRKPAESKDNPITCARIAPFQFEGNSGDPNKPPRGNPDKKLKKQVNDLKSPPVPSTNGINYEKPATSPPLSSSAQPRIPMIPTVGAPKTAIVPVSPATIVIRPRNNASTSTSPSTNLATNVVANEISPAKRMRFSSETSSSQTTVLSGSIPSDPNRVFPGIRQTGRPTLFRPPNVVFPRSANVLNNGTARYAIPFTTQSSGNPTRPYYGNPSFTNRPTVSRDRPQLHSFSRPTTSVIRLVTTEIKTEESVTTAAAATIMQNGIRSRSIDETTVSKIGVKEDETLSNGIVINNNQESTANTALSLPLTSMSQKIHFSTSFPSTTISSTSSDNTSSSSSAGIGTGTQMISLRPHFPLSTATNTIQNQSTMINLQTVTYSTKPTTSLYQVVNATPTLMQSFSPQQLVQTAIPVMLHTVTNSNFTAAPIPTPPPPPPSSSTMINLPMSDPPSSATESGTKSNPEKIVQKSNGTQSSNIIDIPLPDNDDATIDMNSSYSSNESFEIPPPPPPPPEDVINEDSSMLETTVPPEDPSHPFEPSHNHTRLHHFQEQQSVSISEPEIVINGVDPHISASHQSMINKNHSSSSSSYQQFVVSAAPIPSSSSSSLSPSNSDANSSNLLPVEESQNLLLNVSQSSNAPTPAPTITPPTNI
uniref:ENT domain-containing protein n=1 Tax=Panagrolaimus superbus TaxID=310955 RepID=A0A914YCV7_9BILA